MGCLQGQSRSHDEDCIIGASRDKGQAHTGRVCVLESEVEETEIFRNFILEEPH